MKNSRCKICNREDLKEFIRFDRYPRSISHLFPDSITARENFGAYFFDKCEYCQHVQIGEDMPQEFYEDYIMTVSHSPKMNKFQQEQASFFVSNYQLAGKKVLEVGCGDGNFSSILKQLGVDIYGNEPSKPFRDLALAKGINVDSLFVDENYSHSAAPFDAVVSREVMEHVPDPINFLKNIRRVLKHDGYVLIEVPNFEKALSECRYYDMFPDHLSYFTSQSLTAAMLISGFKGVSIYYGMDNEFLYAIAQNQDIESKGLVSAKNTIDRDFKEIFDNYNNVVVWGAGGKGIAALSAVADTSRIKFVIDSDPFKQNRYLPASGVKVVSPEILDIDTGIDMLIITNLAYTDEVLEILASKDYKGDVSVLSREGILKVKSQQIL